MQIMLWNLLEVLLWHRRVHRNPVRCKCHKKILLFFWDNVQLQIKETAFNKWIRKIIVVFTCHVIHVGVVIVQIHVVAHSAGAHLIFTLLSHIELELLYDHGQAHSHSARAVSDRKGCTASSKLLPFRSLHDDRSFFNHASMSRLAFLQKYTRDELLCAVSQIRYMITARKRPFSLYLFIFFYL